MVELNINQSTVVAVEALQLAARIHAARNDPAAWRAALKDCREWVGCSDGILVLAAEDTTLDSSALEALAGRVSHCAIYRPCAGCDSQNDQGRRARCAALALHLHEAAAEARNAQRAALFDHLPPVWIVDRNARVEDSNASARAITASKTPLAVRDGKLVPDVPGGQTRLSDTLGSLEDETHFSWPNSQGGESTLHLRVLAGSAGIAITLLPGPPTVSQLGHLLDQRLNLTARRSELAAHLLTDKTLTDAARAMGISRHTANEHLVALMQDVKASNRKMLLQILRRVVAG